MDIADIAAREYVDVDVAEELGQIRSIFEEERPAGIVVTRDHPRRGVRGRHR